MIQNGKNYIDKTFFSYVGFDVATVPTTKNFFTVAEVGDMDETTNFPGNAGQLPDKNQFQLKKIGFALRSATGAGLAELTIGQIARGVYSLKVNEREIRRGSMAEFFDNPTTAAAGQVAKLAAGLTLVPMEIEEIINSGERLNLSVKLPKISEAVEVGAFMKGLLVQSF